MKKNYGFLFFSLIATIILFNCCKKESITDGEMARNVLNIHDTNFLSWAQANNGRWLSYSIRKSRSESGSTASPQILNTWAKYMGPVNAAKVYYRNLIQRKTGIGSDKIDIYLDSMYVANYKTINKRLKYQKTMDSLFASYKRLNNIRSSRSTDNQGIYVPGQSRDHFRAGAVKNIKLAMQKEIGTINLSAKSKSLMALKSDDPTGYVWSSDNCIPAELTDWFDQQYDNIYSKITAHNPPGTFLDPDYFYGQIKNYNTNKCIGNLFNNFFSAAMGVGFVQQSNGTEFPTPITCGEMTSTIVSNLYDYYNCIDGKNAN